MRAQACLTLCNPMDCSPLGSSVHGILQARILEWVAISSSRGSSQLALAAPTLADSLYHFATWEAKDPQSPKSDSEDGRMEVLICGKDFAF